jgi:hypothetical protein
MAHASQAWAIYGERGREKERGMGEGVVDYTTLTDGARLALALYAFRPNPAVMSDSQFSCHA